MSPEEAELYKDAVKIGVPALAGLLAGLLPYFIEKSKVRAQKIIEDDKAKRALIISFTEALAEYQGSSKAYISNLVCSRYNSGEDWEKIVNSSSQKVFDNQVSRVRAKTLAGIVANPEIIDALLIYDKRVSETMAFLAKNMCADEEAQKEYLSRISDAERALLYSLNQLL